MKPRVLSGTLYISIDKKNIDTMFSILGFALYIICTSSEKGNQTIKHHEHIEVMGGKMFLNRAEHYFHNYSL